MSTEVSCFTLGWSCDREVNLKTWQTSHFPSLSLTQEQLGSKEFGFGHRGTLEGRDGSPEWIQQAGWEVSALNSKAPSPRIVSTVLLNQQFYAGLKHSRSPCTTGVWAGGFVTAHHIWSSTSVCGGTQNSPPPSPGKQQHHWGHAPTSNLDRMTTPFWLILLSFLWNCLFLDAEVDGTLFISLSRDVEEAWPSPPLWESLHSKVNPQQRSCQFAVCKHCFPQCKATPSVVAFPARAGSCQTLWSHRDQRCFICSLPSPRGFGLAFLTQKSVLFPFRLLTFTWPCQHHFSTLHLMENNADKPW